MHDTLLTMILKLLLAGVLGGLIGFEREAHGRPAGLRTHILVSLGSALFTIVSLSYSGERSDPSRIASQIVTGIGFLGAGTIIRQGSIVRGLTTAASLWTTAAIGMAVGTGGGNLTYLAIVASLIVFVTLSVLNRIEHVMISKRETRDLVVTLMNGRAGIAAVLEVFTSQNITVQGVSSEEEEPGVIKAQLQVKLSATENLSALNAELTNLPMVRSFEWE